MKRASLLTLLVLGAVLVTGCAPAQPVPESTSTGTASEPQDGGETLVPVPTTTPDLEEATAAGVDAFTAYADRGLSYSEWWEQLEPHLHASAVEAYATVQPSQIPALEIQDGAATAETSSDTYAVVYVPTSLGQYTIELRRGDTTSSWGVTRFQPPT